MAEDCVDQAATLAQLPEKPCVTQHLHIHGFHKSRKKTRRKDAAKSSVRSPSMVRMRTRFASSSRLMLGLSEPLHPALPYVKAEVIWAARHEMARTVEDVLARRTRALFLNARAALAMAPAVADLMASELGWDDVTRTKIWPHSAR